MSNIHLPPKMRKFDLQPGDIVIAKDEETGERNIRWRVESIHKHIFRCKKFNGKGGYRCFRKVDYKLGNIKPLW